MDLLFKATLILSSASYVVFAVFVTLKLVSLISWQWLWVLSPLWIGCGVASLFMFVFLYLLTFVPW